MSLNALAAEIHAANAHWWHDPATGERLVRNKGEMFMLMVSEVAEAMEGERKNLMDDHLPRRRMAEVELADLKIRLFDYAGGFAIDLDASTGGADPMPVNKGAALLQIVGELTRASEAAQTGFNHWVAWRLRRVLALVDNYAVIHSYDVDGAMVEKRAYNAVRPDHKAEARLAANGKKW